MHFFKRVLPLLILLLFIYAWFLFFYSRSHPQIQNTNTSPQSNLTLFIQPDSGTTPLVNEINNAHKEIDVEVYLLSSKEITSALIDAKNRGVTVHVMLEQHPFGGSGLNPATKKYLEENGITVIWTNSAFPLTHEKSILIDGKEAFIMTQNLTASSFTKNREYDILDLNEKDVEEIKNIFSADWNRTPFYPTVTNLVISPNTSRQKITLLVSDAKSELNIEVEDIADIAFTNLLAEKSKTITVNLLIPPLKTITSNAKDINLLKNTNVHIKTLSSPYIHAKLILADNKNAYVGSVNFSTQSMDENRELGIIINEADVVNSLQTSFARDWQKALPL